MNNPIALILLVLLSKPILATEISKCVKELSVEHKYNTILQKFTKEIEDLQQQSKLVNLQLLEFVIHSHKTTSTPGNTKANSENKRYFLKVLSSLVKSNNYLEVELDKVTELETGYISAQLINAAMPSYDQRLAILEKTSTDLQTRVIENYSADINKQLLQEFVDNKFAEGVTPSSFDLIVQQIHLNRVQLYLKYLKALTNTPQKQIVDFNQKNLFRILSNEMYEAKLLPPRILRTFSTWFDKQAQTAKGIRNNYLVFLQYLEKQNN